jgi:hypothetical protein
MIRAKNILRTVSGRYKPPHTRGPAAIRQVRPRSPQKGKVAYTGRSSTAGISNGAGGEYEGIRLSC